MAALRPETALIQDDNMVAEGQGQRTMADDHMGRSALQMRQVFQYACFGPGVYRRQRVVQQEQGPLEQDGSGQAKACFLAAAQRLALFTEDAVQLFWKCAYFIGQTGHLDGLPQLRIAGLRAGQEQVFADGIGKEERLLGRHAHVGPQPAERDPGNVRIAQENGARGRLVDAGEQVQQGGFAAAHRSDNGRGGAAWQPEIEVVEYRLAFAGIGKGEIPDGPGPAARTADP